MNINHQISMRYALSKCIADVTEQTAQYTKYSILDLESFEAMDFDKLLQLTNDTWGLFREHYRVPHRLFILNNGHSVTVYGR